MARIEADHRAADRWFAAAMEQGPSLPFAHFERGKLRLAHCDVDGAVTEFRESAKRAPRWVGPLKF